MIYILRLVPNDEQPTSLRKQSDIKHKAGAKEAQFSFGYAVDFPLCDDDNQVIFIVDVETHNVVTFRCPSFYFMFVHHKLIVGQ